MYIMQITYKLRIISCYYIRAIDISNVLHVNGCRVKYHDNEVRTCRFAEFHKLKNITTIVFLIFDKVKIDRT